MKQKFISLGLALAMLLGVAGCNVTTPATVGTIGGVEIPAGIYLLAQYNAYKSTASLVDFATGESAEQVNAVLDAQVTGTINGEEVTTDGADYISRLTMASIEYYAAAEAMFDQMGATLEDAATTEAADSAQSMWKSDGDTYKANGISQDTLETYLLNAAKAQACMQLLYGPDGEQPVTDEEYRQFVEQDCRYIESITLPLVDYSTYTFASSDASVLSAIQSLAQECTAYLNANVSGINSMMDYSMLYSAASIYLPQVMAAMGSTMESAQVGYYVGSQLLLPSDLSGYASSDGSNSLTDPLDAANGSWTMVDLGTSLLIARTVDPLSIYDLDTYKTSYNLLSAMKATDFQNELYTRGATLEQALDQGAIRTYKASNIKYSA